MRATRHKPLLSALGRHVSIPLAVGEVLLLLLCGAVQSAEARPITRRAERVSPRRRVAQRWDIRGVPRSSTGWTMDARLKADTGWSGAAKKDSSKADNVVLRIGTDSIPPTVIVSPTTGSTGASPLSVTIVWCDAVSLKSSSRSIHLNSANVTSNFTYVSSTHSGCGAYATSTGSITLVSGPNNLSASIFDNDFNIGSTSATYTYSAASYGVSVTPDGSAKTVSATATNSVNFTVVNTGNVSEQVTLAATCTGTASGCPASLSPITVPYQGSQTVTVLFDAGLGGDTGTVRLRASYSGNPSIADSGSYKVTSQWHNYLLLAKSFLRDAEDASRCANACFVATYAQSTVPYYSLGAPRSVTLVYNSGRIVPRPFLYADVHLGTGAYTTAQQYILEARIDGANVSFANGDTKLHFAVDQGNPQKTVRLAGQLDLGTKATGAYPIDVIVTAQYSDHNEQSIVHDRVLVVNALESPIARGWSIAGVQRLYVQSDGSALITDGAGSAKYFHCTSGTAPCAAGSFQSPDHTRLTSMNISGNTVYFRYYPDSSQAQFDAAGRLTQVDDRFFNQYIYEYDTLGRVSKIRDPYRDFTFAATCIWYGSTWGVDSIREPGADNSSCTSRR